MKSNNSQQYIDLIFANKNKEYGAYELRKNYKKRIIKAGLIVFILALILASLQINRTQKVAIIADHIYPKDTIKIIDVIIPDDVEVIAAVEKNETNLQQSTTKQQVETDLFTEPKIEKNERVKPEEKMEDPRKMSNIGPEKKSGTQFAENTEYRKIGNKDQDGHGIAKDSTTNSRGSNQPLRTGVELKAEYLGNLKSFLSNQLQYPTVALAQKIEGEVIVEFVVDLNGDISSVKVLKGIGGGCDQEAIRVVKKMKKWKAAQKDGKAVASYFVLPIQFILN